MAAKNKLLLFNLWRNDYIVKDKKTGKDKKKKKLSLQVDNFNEKIKKGKKLVKNPFHKVKLYAMLEDGRGPFMIKRLDLVPAKEGPDNLKYVAYVDLEDEHQAILVDDEEE